jgi:hypothetical protein
MRTFRHFSVGRFRVGVSRHGFRWFPWVTRERGGLFWRVLAWRGWIGW